MAYKCFLIFMEYNVCQLMHNREVECFIDNKTHIVVKKGNKNIHKIKIHLFRLHKTY
jgi:hypothetical protein